MTLEASPNQAVTPHATWPLRVAMISNYLPSGSKIGVGYQAHALANGLVERGHRVTMFTACPAPDEARYETVQLPPTARWRTFGFAWRLRGVDLSGYDVVHAHGDDYWLSRDTPPRVRSMHGSCMAEALRIPGIREKTRMLMLGATEVVASVLADRTVLVSPQTRHWLPWISTVIPNGVEPRFHPAPNRRADTPTILFVGTYGNRKRGRLLMDVFADKIRPHLPKARLVMVCSDAPAAEGVTVTGRIAGAELADWFQRAWVFCLPSSYEGFGIPYAEALVSGVPVVSTDNPGARYVLDGGRAGVICPPEELGSHLLRLLTDERARGTATDRGLDRGRMFVLDQVINRYLDIYRELQSGGSVCAP